jgi:hypothetical protein
MSHAAIVSCVKALAQAGKRPRAISAGTGLPLGRVRQILRKAEKPRQPKPKDIPKRTETIAPPPPPSTAKPGPVRSPRNNGRKPPNYIPPGPITPKAETLIRQYDYLIQQFEDPVIKIAALKLLEDQAILWVQEGYQGDPADRFTYFVSFAPARHEWTTAADRSRKAKVGGVP